MSELKAIPISLQEANQFVENLHRHHKPVHRDKYRLAVEVDGFVGGLYKWVDLLVDI